MKKLSLIFSAFLLVFLVSFAENRFDNRRGLLIEEANAIGTTWLRAGYLEEPYRSDLRALLRNYVNARVDLVAIGKFTEARARSEQIQGDMWARTEQLAQARPEHRFVVRDDYPDGGRSAVSRAGRRHDSRSLPAIPCA